jgi:hypothetical protein
MSYNSLFGIGGHSSADVPLRYWYPCQDNAANKVVTDYSPYASNGVSLLNTDQYDSPGPTGWLPNAFSTALTFNARFSPGTNWQPNQHDFSLLIYGKWPTTGLILAKEQDFDDRFLIERIVTGGSVRTTFAGGGSQNQIAVASLAAAWNHVGFVRSGNTQRLSVNGVETSSTLNPLSLNFTATGQWYAQFQGNVAVSGWSLHEGALTSQQIAEAAAGPELVNSIAPAISGTAIVGETLSCSTGTWGLPAPFAGLANGTPVYSYQWRRNGSPIGGATASSYLLIADDAGMSIDCVVRATNSGGFDAGADTASNAVMVEAGGEITPEALIRGPLQRRLISPQIGTRRLIGAAAQRRLISTR